MGAFGPLRRSASVARRGALDPADEHATFMSLQRALACLLPLALGVLVACTRPSQQAHASIPASTPAAQASSTTPDGVPVPPRDGRFLCSGHVTGVRSGDGGPGAHITWQAYSSPRDTTDVTADYLALLGADSHSAENACDIWRLPPSQPRSILEVCPATASGPWSSCATPPPATKSIVMISTMAAANRDRDH